MKISYLSLLGGLTLAAASSSALACSTCKCGDPTITLLGSEKAFSGRFRLGLDLLWRSETQGADNNPRQITTDESRAVLGVAYSASERLSFALQMPYVEKTITRRDFSREQGRGWGDAELTARYRLWKTGPMSGRHIAGLQAGVRAPTGDTVRNNQGQVLNIDAQPDAGAWAGKFGGWYAFHQFPWFVAVSAKYYQFGDAEQGFEPANVWVASASSQYGLTPRFAVELGLDARYSAENRYSGVIDPDSGGTLVVARIGASARLGQELVTRLALQLPAVDELNGDQEEDPTVQVSLAYDF
ncbi:hypothetical protein ATO7_11848 [Oceanococcus atlanticus]|uniref:Transporter n=1 Tax=Oceanococcus atlanticus TaxID=1317117 RepID=A0A1Y1SCD4_9GAMM|nr:hypothetical protein [Oceanococcus atlanticus]ORE85985.1 hypothetical protein ATO7_11848 [Oceanococcus atlanticus]